MPREIFSLHLTFLFIQQHFKMKKSLFAFTMALSAVALSSCSQKPEEADLVLLYTTDVHGACLHYDIKLDQPAKTSLANVSTYLKEQRAINPEAVMLFDTGDFLQGQPSMYYYNYVDTLSPHIVPLIDNYLGYDAIGVGNHDIETGEAVYGQRLPKQFQMPWICANAIDQRTGEPMFQPYCILNKKGIKVAVLGMITPNIGAWLPKQLWQNLEFEDMVECAKHWVPIIQEKEQPDLLVGLFHSGYNYEANGNNIDTPLNENGSVPAAIKVPGFDIVLCGHDHQTNIFSVANINGDSVVVLDAHTQASKIGRADIHLVLDKKTGRYNKEIKAKMIEMKEVTPDPEFCEKFQFAVDKVNEYVNKPLGQLAQTLYGEPGLYGPSDFMDFIHEVQLSATGADISLTAVLTPHDSVPAGPITMRQLFTLYKYENLLFTLRMTGEEVRQFLEFGYGRQFNEMKSANDHLMAFITDEQGNIKTDGFGARFATPTFNFTSAAGIRYTLDLRKPKGNRITILSMSDGSAFDPKKEYSVAINSYQASGGGEFMPVGLGWSKEEMHNRIISTESKDVRRFVSDYIEKQGTIEPHLRGDWDIIPHDWWQKGLLKDMQYIHPN